MQEDTPGDLKTQVLVMPICVESTGLSPKNTHPPWHGPRTSVLRLNLRTTPEQATCKTLIFCCFEQTLKQRQMLQALGNTPLQNSVSLWQERQGCTPSQGLHTIIQLQLQCQACPVLLV